MLKISALLCTAPGGLAIVDCEAPVCHPGEALVRPLRIRICGTDYHIFEGKHPFLEYPRIMGHELAVEIVSAPEGFAPCEICTVNPYLSCGTCRTCRAGKPNCCEKISVLGVHQDGGMAELLTLPAENYVKAEGLSPDACATVEFLAIGAHAVRRANPQPSDSALVVGAGPIGLGVALFARLAGAEVSILDHDRAAHVAEFAGVGALSEASPDSYASVFDATGNRAAMEASFGLVAAGGTYTTMGVIKERIGFSDADFHRLEMALLGSRNATNPDWSQVIAAIRENRIDMPTVPAMANAREASRSFSGSPIASVRMRVRQQPISNFPVWKRHLFPVR